MMRTAAERGIRSGALRTAKVDPRRILEFILVQTMHNTRRNNQVAGLQSLAVVDQVLGDRTGDRDDGKAPEQLADCIGNSRRVPDELAPMARILGQEYHHEYQE